MASKKHKSSALDPLLAGFAAGATAFVLYAMPDWRFEQAVAMTGLGAIIPAAQPPLGMTARLAAMTFAAIGAFLLVWFTLRALSKPAPRKRRPAPVPAAASAPVEIPLELPKLRRADAHPDAPARRPILAGLDLGRPFDEVDVDAPEEKPAEPDPEPVPEAETAAPELLLELQEEIAPAEAAPEIAEVDKVDTKIASSEAQDQEVEPEAAAAAPVQDEEPEAAASEGEPSITELMQRFEAGLRRREAPHWGAAAPRAGDPVDARLQGAIAELQKLARRGS